MSLLADQGFDPPSSYIETISASRRTRTMRIRSRKSVNEPVQVGVMVNGTPDICGGCRPTFNV